jgi:stage II sporulation protein GA (sporulation sigma-E factor processing peptidase)
LGKHFVPVELSYGGEKVTLTALQDTGNSLRDPLTGQPVLVIGANAAQKLTGLTPEQIRDPAKALTALPGLRLVPYRAVGRQNGMLLALKMDNVKIGAFRGSRVVAFAPEGLGENGEYQALTGGKL